MENLNFFWVVSIGLHTKVLYSGGEGSGSNGVVPNQEYIKFQHFIKWPSLQHQGGYGIKDSSVYLALLGPAGGRGCARAEHRTEESLIQPAPPVPALPGPLEWPYSLIRPK